MASAPMTSSTAIPPTNNNAAESTGVMEYIQSVTGQSQSSGVPTEGHGDDTKGSVTHLSESLHDNFAIDESASKNTNDKYTSRSSSTAKTITQLSQTDQIGVTTEHDPLVTPRQESSDQSQKSLDRPPSYASNRRAPERSWESFNKWIPGYEAREQRRVNCEFFKDSRC